MKMKLWLVTSLIFLAGCSTAPTAHRPTAVGAEVEVRSRLTLEQSNDVTIYAMSLVGTPYRHGGNTPQSGFDCSGLIGHVYQSRASVRAPRTVLALSDWGTAVPAPSVRTGDLVVFIQGGSATHAGIYVGEGRFVHAPSTGGEVRLDSLRSNYWSKQTVAFRRP
jgi:cell wall-associated NlpC family hydrolase